MPESWTIGREGAAKKIRRKMEMFTILIVDIQMSKLGQACWLTSVIPATMEAEISRISLRPAQAKSKQGPISNNKICMVVCTWHPSCVGKGRP
jgi:hypothetical protein